MFHQQSNNNNSNYNCNSIPPEIMFLILNILGNEDLRNLVLVSKSFYKIISSNSFLNDKRLTHYNNLQDFTGIFKNMNKCSVDIAVLGDESSGITSLVQRLITGRFPEKIKPVYGWDCTELEFNNNCSIKLFDCKKCGESQYKPYDSILSRAKLVILCFDGKKQQSFQEFIGYNYDLINILQMSDAPVIIVSTKGDLLSEDFRLQIKSKDFMAKKIEESIKQSREDKIRKLKNNDEYINATSKNIVLFSNIDYSFVNCNSKVIGHINVSSKTGMGINELLIRIRDHCIKPTIKQHLQDDQSARKREVKIEEESSRSNKQKCSLM